MKQWDVLLPQRGSGNMIRAVSGRPSGRDRRHSSKSERAGAGGEERRDLDDGSAVRNHVPGKPSGSRIGAASRAPRKEQIPFEGGPAAGNHVPGPPPGNMIGTVSGNLLDAFGVLVGRLGALLKASGRLGALLKASWAVSEPSCGKPLWALFGPV